MTGSSKLTPEQSQVYLDKLGNRYTHVQEMPSRPSRKARRLANRKRQEETK